MTRLTSPHEWGTPRHRKREKASAKLAFVILCAVLVAEEFCGAATEADTSESEDDGQGEEERVPIDHGAGPAG